MPNFDLDAWLKELAAEGALTDEELGTLKTALGKEKVLQRIEEGQLRQADYSRAMNALTEKEKATLDLQQQLVAWKAEAEWKIQESNLTARQAQEARAQIEARLNHVAQTYNIDPASLGIAPNPNPATNTTAADNGTNAGATPAAFVKREDWEKELGQIRTMFPLLPATLYELSVEHMELFKAPLKGTPELVRKAMDQNKSLREVWEAEHKVPERRQQIQEEAIQARINQAVAKRETELRSELQLPPTPRADAHSPVLTEFKQPPQDRKEMSAVDAATQAWSEHRYAPGEQGTAS